MLFVKTGLVGLVCLLLAGCLLDRPLPGSQHAEAGADLCGSSAVDPFIGGSVDLIPADLIGPSARVYPTGSMLTLDYRLDRLNVEYDPDTRQVVRVKCG